FYDYHSCLMEPWDGPATVPFTDGRFIGAVLDRNGLRPSRYTITKDGFAILASETGVLDIDPANIVEKGRLQPGRMFLVDLEEQRIVSDDEIKDRMASRRPYRQWIDEQLVRLDQLEAPAPEPNRDPLPLETRQQIFGYTLEDLKLLIAPMAKVGYEALGSMGDDTPLAVLSERPRLLYDYFKQLFAQVTNPPLDAIREELVTSLFTNLGYEQDIFDETPQHAHQLRVDRPVITAKEMAKIRPLDMGVLRTKTIPILFEVSRGGEGLRDALEALKAETEKAIDDGWTLIVLSDREADGDHAPIPALLATAAVHHRLIQRGKRNRCGLVIESGEPR